MRLPARMNLHRRIWTPEDDTTLLSMLKKGDSNAKIAFKLKRTEFGIIGRARILHLSTAKNRRGEQN